MLDTRTSADKVCCDSEWPYEVTETLPAPVMHCQDWGCDSEWPYEVTETRTARETPWLIRIEVAIVNGRMRSLKHARAWIEANLAEHVAIVNGRMRSLKHA